MRCTQRWLPIFVIAMFAPFALGQAQRFGRNVAPHDPEVTDVPYNGRFTFARLRYAVAEGGYYYGGLPSWAHGYDMAERNLVQILNELTTIGPRLDGSKVIAIDDPQLFKYPLSYLSEAGFWTMTDKEALSLRAYLKKGGFIIFDDFRDDFRGGGGWDNFAHQMWRVIPGAKFIDLDPSHPIFHSFFEIKSFDIIPQYYDRGRPVMRAIFDDNDPTKRMLAIINFNTDISNFWEFSADGFVPIDLSNEAYKLGVNYVVYAMTH
ncbi:MAG: DUF4159 domain-containing protein [Gemmatimonadaceae bacterium]